MHPYRCLAHRARPDEKMSRAELRGRLEWMEGRLLFVQRAPSSVERQISKRYSNAKRRRRDKLVDP